MSFQLPQFPNLVSLRKQAKALHRKMGQGKLADAQHTLAQEDGFATWAQLKSHVESLQRTPAEALRAAVCACDANRVCRLLETHLELQSTIDAPLPNYGFGQHALFAAVQRTDRATIEVILAAGADIRKRTDWWAGGIGVLDECDPGLVDFLAERGALLDAHSAARLGLTAELREFVAADPAIVHARGGGGQTPLHFASTVEVAQFLLDLSADIDALDVDHESMPASYMLRVQQKRRYPRDRQDVARHLIARGCNTPEEVKLELALGDEAVFQRLLALNADAARTLAEREPEKLPNSAQDNNTKAVRLMLQAGWMVDTPALEPSDAVLEVLP
jgi:hypothetical protein